jgi:hypothetical protein
MLARPRIAILIHVLNILIGVLSIAILALVVRSAVLTDSLSDVMPQDVKGTGRSMLFWPGIGGIVDMLLFVFLWYLSPSEGDLVSSYAIIPCAVTDYRAAVQQAASVFECSALRHKFNLCTAVYRARIHLRRDGPGSQNVVETRDRLRQY